MTEYKKNCFAFCREGRCHALVEMDCKNCRFYKPMKSVKNNPFYAKSYLSPDAHKRDMKKYNIKEDVVKWN